MNYDEMPAGREMDALVAEKVMGWRLDASCGYSTWMGGKADSRGMRWTIDGWKPSADIAAAWGVVEKVREEFRYVSVTAGNGWSCSAWDVEKAKRLREVHAFADTAPLAICRAALLAVGVKP